MAFFWPESSGQKHRQHFSIPFFTEPPHTRIERASESQFVRRFVWSFDFSTRGRLPRLPTKEHAPCSSTIYDVNFTSSSGGFGPRIPIFFASRNRLAPKPHLGQASPLPALMMTT